MSIRSFFFFFFKIHSLLPKKLMEIPASVPLATPKLIGVYSGPRPIVVIHSFHRPSLMINSHRVLSPVLLFHCYLKVESGDYGGMLNSLLRATLKGQTGSTSETLGMCRIQFVYMIFNPRHLPDSVEI